MEFRSNTGFFIPDPFHRTLKNQFSFTLRYNSTTIFSDLTYGRETLKNKEDNQQGGGFQVEEAMVGGQISDPVTPPASEVGNPDEEVYYEPVTGRGTGRLFRSKGEVLEFLETGTRRKRKSKPRDNNGLSLKGKTEGNDNSDISKVTGRGFQVEEAMAGGGSKFSRNSDPVTPPATSEVGNPDDELGLQTAMVRPMVESSSAEFKKKRKRGVTGSSLKPGNVEGADRPEWLPDGWEMVRKQRKNGGPAGLIETVYYEPVTGPRTGRLFRSKGEVLEFLETGTRRKRKSKPRDNNGHALKGNTQGNDNSDTSKVMVSS